MPGGTVGIVFVAIGVIAIKTRLAFALFLLFAGALRSYLGGADETGVRPGSTMLGGAVLAVSMIFAGTAVLNGAVFQVASAGDANLNHALYDVANDLFLATGFGFAVMFIDAARQSQ